MGLGFGLRQCGFGAREFGGEHRRLGLGRRVGRSLGIDRNVLLIVVVVLIVFFLILIILVLLVVLIDLVVAAAVELNGHVGRVRNECGLIGGLVDLFKLFVVGFGFRLVIKRACAALVVIARLGLDLVGIELSILILVLNVLALLIILALLLIRAIPNRFEVL